MKKYISWSELSCWKWDENEWYDRYIKGEPFEPNEDVVLGKHIHSWMENEKYPIYKEIKEMGFKGKRRANLRKMLNKAQRKRAPDKELAIRAELDDEIKLFGYFDGFDKENGILKEYKTSPKADEKWNQWRVDKNGQLSFYALIYKLIFHDYFREIQLIAMDTTKGNVKTYKTARGPRDIEYIEGEIRKFTKRIKGRGLWEKRLSRKERSMLRQKKLIE